MLRMYLAAPIRFVFADAGFAGKLVEWATTILRTTLHIVRKPEGQQGFAVIPRLWCVEPTLAWLTAHRRIARGQPATRQPRWHWPDDQ
jgi:transposase